MTMILKTANAITPVSIQRAPSNTIPIELTIPNVSQIVSTVMDRSLNFLCSYSCRKESKTTQPAIAKTAKPRRCNPQTVPAAPNPIETAKWLMTRSSFGLLLAIETSKVAPMAPTIMKISTSGPTARIRRFKKSSSKREGIKFALSHR